MTSLFSLENKTAIVTGGAKGIGQSICEVFARQGARVFLLDVDEEGGEQTALKIRQDGGSAVFKKCNVASHEETGQAFKQIFQEAGQLDILVNNAGVAHIGNAETTTEADLDRIYQVNIKGIYNCLHFGLPLMKQSGGGAILNMASVASVTGISDRFAYSMSKGAVLAMAYSVAKDYIADNIRCNAIGPGRVHTPFVDGYLRNTYPGREQEMYDKLAKTQPIGRMGEPEEIAQLALYLCSDEAGFITGAFYPIDGGFITLNT
ncbi:MAG: glucose 1-dehydrogenase [Phaeodactylibacter sp.]|nr:glucose 1-dehydrogenase [Phaeodactylibacter sp.]MCB9276160.1 glucose 1-dehydrogenase [Lewinellaceae bacterium]